MPLEWKTTRRNIELSTLEARTVSWEVRGLRAGCWETASCECRRAGEGEAHTVDTSFLLAVFGTCSASDAGDFRRSVLMV